MCRLFGWAATAPRSAEQLLGPDVLRLQELSQLHRDGWGAAWIGPTGVERYREENPAYESAVFVDAARDHFAEVGLVHLRWATGELAVCLENTHPFVRDEIAFIHNGSVPVGPELEAIVDPDLRHSAEGTTDSEQYFLAVLSAYRRLGSVPDAFAHVISAVDGLAYPSLNAMWAQPGRLYVVSAHQNQHRAAALPDDYYTLFYRDVDGTTTAWSSEVTRSTDEKELPNYTVLAADAASGTHELIKLS